MDSRLKKLSVKHKNNKFLYYIVNFGRQIFSSKYFLPGIDKKMAALKKYDTDYIRKRINYYNKLEENISLSDYVQRLENFKMRKKNKTYFFDTYEYSRYFNPDLRMDFKFGDVTFVPEEPAIVKSRPIKSDNSNSVILNLDKVRHFTFLNDKRDFLQKKDMLVSRNEVNQAHRIKFLEMYINHPLCNIGKVNNDDKYPHLVKGRLTFEEQLENKFILCLEGNDVASNLKWVMSSHSLAVMPLPKYETWFMEGTLIPDYHYMLIKDDYSDLEERMKYYMSHPKEALEIIKNANQYIEQFRIRQREDLLSLLVLEKYFYKTNQKDIEEDLKLLFSSNHRTKGY
jgi:hypothetical protein